MRSSQDQVPLLAEDFEVDLSNENDELNMEETMLYKPNTTRKKQDTKGSRFLMLISIGSIMIIAFVAVYIVLPTIQQWLFPSKDYRHECMMCLANASSSNHTMKGMKVLLKQAGNSTKCSAQCGGFLNSIESDMVPESTTTTTQTWGDEYASGDSAEEIKNELKHEFNRVDVPDADSSSSGDEEKTSVSNPDSESSGAIKTINNVTISLTKTMNDNKNINKESSFTNDDDSSGDVMTGTDAKLFRGIVKNIYEEYEHYDYDDKYESYKK